MTQRRRKFLALAVITLVIIGVVLLLSLYSLQQPNSHITVNPSSNNWPMFHHDLNHTGYTTSTSPASPSLLWSNTTEHRPSNILTREGILSSPVVAEGYLYIGAEYGNLYCFNASNGEHLWAYSTNATISSAPSVAGDYVYVGTDNIYCLDALTGFEVWSFKPSAGIYYSSPAVADGCLYIVAYDGNVYCLDALSGSKIWSYQTYGTGLSSPAIVNDFVYVGSGDGNINCLNARTGEKVWSFMTGADTPAMAHAVSSSPTVVDGFVYAGSLDGKVYCLNATDGKQVWNYNTRSRVESSPAIALGYLYIGSSDSNLYCLNASSGQKIWNYSATLSDVPAFGVQSSPALASNYVYFGSANYIYCLNAATGDKIWDYAAHGNIGRNSPAIANGTLYITTENGFVYAFG